MSDVLHQDIGAEGWRDGRIAKCLLGKPEFGSANTHVKSWVWWRASVTPVLEEEGRGRMTSGAHWPGSLSELMSTRSDERPCLKNREQVRKTPKVGLGPPHAHACTCSHTQVYTRCDGLNVRRRLRCLHTLSQVDGAVGEVWEIRPCWRKYATQHRL